MLPPFVIIYRFYTFCMSSVIIDIHHATGSHQKRKDVAIVKVRNEDRFITLVTRLSEEDKEIVRKFLTSLKEKQQDAKLPVGLPPKET